MLHDSAPAPVAGEVRLAELVAALSLGVDLGFGQPMEHVLRQCVISLRLTDVLGMDERDRFVVYYGGLLINVGCHADAHKQAKWFGDDIALKSSKYVRDMRSLRGAVASLRLVGAGNPPLHPFRVGARVRRPRTPRHGRHDHDTLRDRAVPGPWCFAVFWRCRRPVGRGDTPVTRGSWTLLFVSRGAWSLSG